MACQLENEPCCIKHYLGVYEQNVTVKSVRVDGRTGNLAIIDSNGFQQKFGTCS